MAIPAGRVQPFSTGASYVYLSFGAQPHSAGPYFFGTCEGYPKHERRPDYMQLMNDVSGRKKPMDMSFQGMDATISLTMTVWDEGIAQMLQQFADLSGLTGLATPGAYRFSDVGTLMGFEQYTVQIWIAYSYGTAIAGSAGTPKAAYTAGGLPAGYHYWQGIPFAPDATEEGAQPLLRNINFYVWPWCNWHTQQFILYDFNMAPIAGVPLNGPVVA